MPPLFGAAGLPLWAAARSVGRSGLQCYAAVAAPATKAAPAAAGIKEAHGFELQRVEYIKEYDSHMLVYKHKKTGVCVCEPGVSGGVLCCEVCEWAKFVRNLEVDHVWGVSAAHVMLRC